MKRNLCLILSVMMLVSLLGGCVGSPAQTTAPTDPSDPSGTADGPTQTPTLPPETTVPSEPTEPSTPPASEDPALDELRNNLPVMDGSTSLIPLEAGIRAALYGKSIEEATKDVAHTTSWESFYNLIFDRADLIFSVPLSADQETLAAEQNVVLEAVPIAKEGFVFVVNAENPVDSLTQQQIKDIYSGKITNWAQVGGLDEEIIPYQRNVDSGSQNYMIAFMGSTPLMDAPSELRPASMSGLMDVIAVNDNARAAIGYSVYAYAADMYGNGNEIKFIEVDGVAPSKQTFADGSYPLMGYNYAVFNADEPEDSYVRQLVRWMLTPAGQLAIAKAGYVTVTDIGFDYEEQTITRYSGTGTGAPAAEPESYEYFLYETVIEHFDTGYNQWDSEMRYNVLVPEIVTRSDGTQVYQINQLADDALESQINHWLAGQMEWVMAYQDDMLEHVQWLNQNYEYGRYTIEGFSGLLPQTSSIGSSTCIITVKNGILSAVVTLRYFECVMDAIPRYYRTETASWDLFTGQQLTAEDLFCQGVDIDETLNAYLRTVSQSVQGEFSPAPVLIADFATLPLEGWHITHDAIYFDYGNPYFFHGEEFSLSDLPEGTLVSQHPRDFSAALDSDSVHVCKQFRVYQQSLYYAYNADRLLSCGFLKEDVHPNATKINAEVMDFLNTYYTEDAIRGYFEDAGYDSSNLDLWMLDWYTENLGNKYLIFNGYSIELYVESTNSFVTYPAETILIYDLETGQRIQDWQDLLLPGWESSVTWDEGKAAPSGLDGALQWFRVYNGDCMFFCIREGDQYYYARISPDYFRY